MYRSRLQKLEEKRNLRRATFLGLGSILTVIALIILGIPFLIRLAVFIADLRSASQPIDKNDTIPPVPPQISLPYDATNAAVQTISGWAEPGSKVFLTVNTQAGGDTVVGKDGSFIIPSVGLNPGNNTLTATAIDQAGNQSAPTQLALFFSKEPPRLEIISPADHSQTSGNSVQVSGETSPGTRLTINNRLAIVAADGKFSTQISLNPGENVLIIIASDRAGNQTRKELTVTATP